MNFIKTHLNSLAMNILENEPLSKRYVRWKTVSMSLLCAGIIFLFEALTRIGTISMSGIGFMDFTTWTPIICMLSALCANMAQKNKYSTNGLRWTTASLILLTIGLILFFESIANVGSDIFAAFNFFALALTSSLLCSIGVICEKYSQKFEFDLLNK